MDLIILLTILALSIGVSSVWGRPIYINKLPYTINQSGYYILNTSCKNLPLTAITIDADNVVLDGNGNVLDGVGTDNICCGIYITGHNITIKNLTVKEFGTGIMFDSSSNNTITNVNVYDNRYGIFLEDSSNNTIINNTFKNCGLDVSIGSFNNKVENNTVNGKPLVYLENEKNKVINNAGQVIAINCENITVKDVELNNASIGIGFYNVSNSKITNVNVYNNSEYGIFLIGSSNNTITNINACNNRAGIFLWDSSSNIIYLNNFINNTNNIYIERHSQNNTFHSLTKINYTYNGTNHTNYLGNYYSDYSGKDNNSDGIGDTPYIIDANNNITDKYPLISPIENYIIINKSTENVINGTTITENTTKIITKPDLTEKICTEYLDYRTPGEIEIKVKNIGNKEVTEPFNVTINISGEIYKEEINNLSINEEKTLTFNYTPNETGTIKVTVIVDEGNRINESNENNNVITKEIPIIEQPVYVTIDTTKIINNILNASIIIVNPNDKRTITKFNGTLNLTNLEIINYSPQEVYVNKTTGFFNGTITNGTGTINILTLELKVINISKNYTIDLENINLLDEGNYTFNNIKIIHSTITNKIKIENVKIIPSENINISVVPLNETPINITVPLINTTIDKVLSEINISAIEEILPTAKEINIEEIKDTNTAEEIANKILENIKPVISKGFNITKKMKEVKEEGNKIITNITINITNTSSKGFITLVVPVGDIDNFTIYSRW